jgi:hypothetical protein
MSFAINKNAINRKGRTPGVPNKDTAEIKAVFQLLLENNIERLQEDFEALQPAQRIKFLLEVASFIIPKMKSTELAIDNKRIYEPITINMNDWK